MKQSLFQKKLAPKLAKFQLKQPDFKMPTTPVVLFLILFVRPVVSLFTLCTLFTEPRVGKVQAQRLEEDAKSHRNCRHSYSLLADSAAIAAAITPPHNLSPG